MTGTGGTSLIIIRKNLHGHQLANAAKNTLLCQSARGIMKSGVHTIEGGMSSWRSDLLSGHKEGIRTQLPACCHDLLPMIFVQVHKVLSHEVVRSEKDGTRDG